jgi:hypothetical protein
VAGISGKLNVQPLTTHPGTFNKHKVTKLLFVEQLSKPFCALKIRNANVRGHPFQVVTVRLASHNAIQFQAAEATCYR